MIRSFRSLVSLLVIVSGFLAAVASAATSPIPIEFPRGASSTSVHGGIARGETPRYTFSARADQWIEIVLTSVEGNAVAQIYRPGWRLGATGEVVSGDLQIEIGADAGSGEWSEVLPATGTYLVQLGTARGGAEFDLELAIRAPVAEDCGELSQGPMNACYAALARDAEAQRGRAYASLEALLDGDERGRLAAAERAWRGYLDAECNYEAALYEGGSLQPTIHGTCVIRLTLQRQAELEDQRRVREEL
jgi:uncharacterized protein YecT (DUF1311 family)